MRILVLCLALLLAGCTANESPYDPDPGDTDTETPRLTDTPGAGGATPTTPPASPGSGGSFAPQQHHAEATDDALPGLVLEGDLSECDAGFCVSAEARNEGNETYFVQALCRGPWEETLLQDGQAATHREPVAQCAAFQLEPFTPGDDRPLEMEWNGTLWQEGYVDAPQGAYTWVLEFEVWTEEQDGQRHALRAEFPVVVGAT